MLGKLFKWGASYLRALLWKLRYGSRLRLGKAVYFGKGCTLVIPAGGSVTLGDRVYLSAHTHLETVGSGSICLKNGTFLNTYSRVCAMESVRVGQGCMLGSNVSVYDHDHDVSHGVRAGASAYRTGAVTVGDGVWLCTNVVVTRGSRVGSNNVVGANAVVTGELPPNGVWAGVPARRRSDIPEGEAQ